MRHPAIIVLGHSEASMFLRTRAAEIGAVISIRGQREPSLPHAIANGLELMFDDIEVPSDPISRAQMELRWKHEAENGITYTPPAREHAASIIDFAQRHTELSGAVLCQCSAGISRSPAAALLCLVTWTAPGDEAKCVQALREIRPAAMPNRMLLRLGDELLSRDGALVDACSNVEGH